jgi:hypothetical protein
VSVLSGGGGGSSTRWYRRLKLLKRGGGVRNQGEGISGIGLKQGSVEIGKICVPIIKANVMAQINLRHETR